MIGLSITGKEKILLTELPQDIYQLHNKLYTELGIHLFPGKIKLIDSNDRIVSVKLSSVDELGEHLIKLFTPQNTVEDVNSAANIVANADEHLHGIMHHGRVRRLTPRECWRLQGFTDEQFDRAVAAGLSDGRLYKMAGNAVSVPVITALGYKIKQIYERM